MVTYCAATDVQRIMGNSYAFSVSTNPTQAQVEAFIEEAEDDIDAETGHSWRETTITNEFYDLHANEVHSVYGLPVMKIHLRHRQIRTLSTGDGDKIEVWDGDSYTDYVVSKTEGRGDDFWLDYEQGILYIRKVYQSFRVKGVRMTYRYGASTVPKDVRQATALLTAINLILNDDKTSALDDTAGSKNAGHMQRIERMQMRVDKILANRREIQVF